MKLKEHDISASSKGEPSEGGCYDGLSGDIYSDWADEVTEACNRARARDNGFIEIREKTDNHDYTIDSPEACTDQEWQVIANTQAENERQLFADVFGAFAYNRYGFGGDLPMKVYELCKSELVDGEDIPEVLAAVRKAYDESEDWDPWTGSSIRDGNQVWEECLDTIAEFLSDIPAANELGGADALLDQLKDMVAPLKPGVDIGDDWIMCSKSTFRNFKGFLRMVTRVPD